MGVQVNAIFSLDVGAGGGGDGRSSRVQKCSLGLELPDGSCAARRGVGRLTS